MNKIARRSLQTKAQDIALVDLGGVTWCPVSSAHFVDRVVEDILRVATAFIGGKLILGGFTPPQEACTAIRMLELHLSKGKLQAKLGIAFDVTPSLPGIPERNDFQERDWIEDPESALSAGIVAANFDEAWHLACTIVRRLDVASLAIAYGT